MGGQVKFEYLAPCVPRHAFEGRHPVMSFPLRVKDSAVSLGSLTASLLRKQESSLSRHAFEGRHPVMSFPLRVKDSGSFGQCVFFASKRLSSFAWQLYCFAPAKAGIQNPVLKGDNI